jgi:hypothetical protein
MLNKIQQKLLPCFEPGREVSCGRAVPPPRGPNGEFRLIAGADWDFGSAGPMLIPGSDVLLQGTKDGIIYALDKNDLGVYQRTLL